MNRLESKDSNLKNILKSILSYIDQKDEENQKSHRRFIKYFDEFNKNILRNFDKINNNFKYYQLRSDLDVKELIERNEKLKLEFKKEI